MKTMFDELATVFADRKIEPLHELLDTYRGEKNLAKCYATFGFLSCAGSGGAIPLAEAMGELIESFYLATSIHDDVVDSKDEAVQERVEQFSLNSMMVLGNCFFVRLGMAIAKATPHMKEERRQLVLDRFEQYMMDVAESQIVDVQTHWETPTQIAAERQMKLRGGTWGRFCMEIPALAGGLGEQDAATLGDAGELLFIALTVRDDLRDLRDDILNGVLTLAPAIFFGHPDRDSDFNFNAPVDGRQANALVDLLHSDGAIERALHRGQIATRQALDILDEFIEDRSNMHWYLLLMLFRLMVKQFDEFTPQHVLEGKLGIGISESAKLPDPE